jgi:ribose/xylose/arabinose/galactoside ABC-type transport system permease subunit
MRVSQEETALKGGKSPLRELITSQPFWVTIALGLICLVMSQVSNVFFTEDNFFNVTRNFAFIGIIAMGMTAVIISGGIDLSVGSMMALCGMVAGMVMTRNGQIVPTPGLMWLGTLAGLVSGLLCGLLNGGLITKLNLPPFIVTLGTMSAFRGISYMMHHNAMYDVPSYTFLGQGSIAAIPASVLIFVLIVLLAFFILRYTPLGRYTYAIGSNRQAAYHAGVNVNLNLLAIYALTGLSVGLAAMIAMSRTVSAQPTAGISLELDIIAAVVIGGASLSGGRGTVIGTIIGTLLISFLRNGLTLLGISTNVQLVVIGAIIIGAVALDQMARAKAEAA